ncbi:MAG: TonB-dependent receptor [Prevotellaceae bacterium]|jgi:TonB-linked SusC/RagA family outer membrane protein|nr:TonB-dependent receptor [Prevotellaceae bacterium]
MNIKILLNSVMHNAYKIMLITLVTLFTYAIPSIAGVADKTINGTVKDINGKPIIGATVQIKSSSVGVVTDENGSFSLSVPDNATLQISCVSYVMQEIAVGNQDYFSIVLEEDQMLLEEAVIVGFGKQKKESVVGAVQTINPKELRIQSSSLSNAFAGRLAGIVAVQRSGEPGADGASFWIRGISTFASNTSPLIFIDGVEVSSGDMNSLPPETIEGFSVLKDATATALYGARGANGVILITTREGKNMEKAIINVRAEWQMTQPTRFVELADGVDYMTLYNEARRTRGTEDVGNPSDGYYEAQKGFSLSKIENTRLGKDPYLYPNINWQKMLFKPQSFNQTVNMNVTGGGSKVTYFMNAGFNNDNGMLRSDPQNVFDNNIRQQRYTFRGNIIGQLTSTTKATLRLNTEIVNYGGSRISTSNLYTSLFESPGVLFPAYFPSTGNTDHIQFGNLQGGPQPTYGTNAYNNPYMDMVTGYSDRNSNTNIVAFELNQDLSFITPGLRAAGLISFKNWSSTTVTRSFVPHMYEIDKSTIKENPDGTYDYEIRNFNTTGTTALSTSTGTSGDRYMNIQASLDYARTFAGVHEVGAMIVYLQRDYNNNNPGDYYATLPTRNQGIAGRATYAYGGRYLAEANFGYNGSENFQDGNRFGFFPSFAVGYNISNENFWKPLKNIVSNLKLRGSWGIVGNSSTDGRFPYLSFVNLNGRSFTFGNEWQTTRSGAVVTRFGADGAQWEKGVKVNLGLDLSLFNAISITADMFREKRDGIFMRYRTLTAESGVTGERIPYANLGKVTNEGIDLTLDYNKALLNNDLIISLKGTFTYAKNILNDRDEPPYPDNEAYRSELGKSLNVNTGLVALGLFKDEADIANSPTQTFSDYGVGDIKYKDMNEDGKIDANDRMLIGDPTVPQIVYGFGGSVQYKGFDFSIFFQGVAKTSLLMGNIHPYNDLYSQLYQFIADDIWTEANPNPNAKYPRLVTMDGQLAHNNHQASSFYMRNGAFMRLKNVEAGYTFKFARLYIAGQNLLTWSPFTHWDPEVGGGRGLSYPTLKTVSIGLQLNF